MTVPLLHAICIGLVVAIPMGFAFATAMNVIHARTKITRMKRILDRLVWPMSQAEFGEMQFTWAAFTQQVYGDSRNFMSHQEGSVSPEFKAKIEARLGIEI